MPLIFRDKKGKILGREWSDNIDVDSHMRNHGFPVDCLIEKVTKQKLLKTIPHKTELKMYREPYERRALEIENRITLIIEALEEAGEKGIQFKKGDLKAMIEAKLRNDPTG